MRLDAFENPDYAIHEAFGGYVVVRTFWNTEGVEEQKVHVVATIEDVAALIVRFSHECNACPEVVEEAEDAMRGGR